MRTAPAIRIGVVSKDLCKHNVFDRFLNVWGWFREGFREGFSRFICRVIENGNVEKNCVLPWENQYFKVSPFEFLIKHRFENDKNLLPETSRGARNGQNRVPEDPQRRPRSP